MIKNRFFPDKRYKSIHDIDVFGLKESGIKFLILDIDNTVVPYTSKNPDDAALRFFEALKKAGIIFSFVSNNSKTRVNTFNEEIKAYAVPRGAKPLLFGVKKAMRLMGADKSNTALIGDQIFTDVYAGKRAGLYTILVDPICECESTFFKVKRYYEKKIIKRYEELSEMGK